MSIPARGRRGSYPAWQRAETIRSKAYRCVPSVHCAMALWSEDSRHDAIRSADS
jgi:hypothetical protein